MPAAISIESLMQVKFGQLRIIGPVPNRGAVRRVLCECDCGARKEFNLAYVRNGRTKSCGCYRRAFTTRKNTIHGHASSGNQSKAYIVWSHMIGRCYNKNDNRYPLYGARGIQVCEEWRSSFEAFLEDMGEPPPGMSIERKKNNEGYSVANCKWATSSEQARNRRSNRMIEFRGRTQCLIEWAEEFGLPYMLLYGRLAHGWTMEKSLLTPRAGSVPESATAAEAVVEEVP